MGFFVHFRGEFECVQCRKTSDAWIQTKLLRHDAENCYRRYQVGDTEVMDGLGDYLPLHMWDGSTQLVVAVGDWECDHCCCAWQWARAVFEVQAAKPHSQVEIRNLSTLQPWQPADLNGIHFVEYELARLSGLWEGVNGLEGWDRWEACSVGERCERVTAGFREWCREVVGVTEPRRGDRE